MIDELLDFFNSVTVMIHVLGVVNQDRNFVASLDESRNFTCVDGVADESGANIAQHFEPSYQFVEEAESEGGKVLIHCGAGASRSATLCAAYLMRVRRWKVKQTLELVILSCLSV